ncbi:segregation/condensation protein A [Propionibacterium freudenreichii]|nr:segregation/condensation protein A [Propionibacterium freudenreichii]
MLRPAMTSTNPEQGRESSSFRVRLDNFDGPFDLLLQLINKHRLDITEVALSKVTDEFIAHVRVGGRAWDLDQTSSFLVVAATLLDLKAARLLPGGEVDDTEDLALLEARDLLFARLLQYRAFKQISKVFAAAMRREELVHPRPGGLEDRFLDVQPELRIPGGADRLATLAVRALTPAEALDMPLEQLHIVTVNVAEQADLVVARLRAAGTLSFRALTADADRMTIVARFLALLELFRHAAVAFEQLTPLGELTVRWTGRQEGEVSISNEFDISGPVDSTESSVAPDVREGHEPAPIRAGGTGDDTMEEL